jgi:hypothetical protein
MRERRTQWPRPPLSTTAPTPEPFTRADRDTTTILFGGLHWRIERIIQGVFEGSGYQARIRRWRPRKTC